MISFSSNVTSKSRTGSRGKLRDSLLVHVDDDVDEVIENKILFAKSIVLLEHELDLFVVFNCISQLHE